MRQFYLISKSVLIKFLDTFGFGKCEHDCVIHFFLKADIILPI